MKILKNRKGFTLVELCVVMAVAAIVGTMVVTTTVFISKQNSDIQKEAAFISEVTDIQKQINNWLKKYDSAGYQIAHDSSQKSLTASKGSQVCKITFSDSVIKADDTAISEKYKNVSGISFQVVEDKAADGSIEGEIAQVKITAKKGTGTEVQTLLFPIFSNKSRARSVTGKNG